MPEKSLKLSRLHFIIPAVCLVISCLVIFFNMEQLAQNPFDREVFLDEPTSAAENTFGTTAVLDSGGTRILILSPDDTVTGSITYSGTSSYTPSQARDLVITDNRILVLDILTGVNGTSSEGDRVLVYDLDGNFKEILIDSESLFSEEHRWRIYTLAAYENRVYASLYDENNPEVLVNAEITDGSLNILHTFDTGGLDLYDAFYSPAEDCTAAVAYNGKILIWQDENPIATDVNVSDLFADDVRMADDGSLIILDQNANGIFRFIEGSSSLNKLVETGAVNFSISENNLIFTDPVSYTFSRINLTSGDVTVADSFFLSRNRQISGIAVWVFAGLGAVSAVMLTIRLTLLWIARNKAESGIRAQLKEGKGKLTTTRLYGPLFLTFIFVFAVMALILGNFYYENEISNRRTAVMNAGYALRELSKTDGIGDALEQINSQDDYDSEAYNLVTTAARAVFMSGLDVSGSLNLPYQVYRFTDNSNDLMVVADSSGSLRTGLVLTEKEQEMKGLSEPASAAREGVVLAGDGVYNNGIKRYTVYEPVYNSDGKAVGLVTPVLNLTLASTQINDELTEQLVTLFTLLAGLMMICAETVYFLKVCRLKRIRRHQGITGKTIVEVERTMEILMRLPSSVFLIFVTLIASDILETNGISNTLLLAIPLTFDKIAFTAARSFLGPAVKYNPRFYLLLGIAGTVLGFILMGVAILLNGFVLLIFSAFVFGIANGMTYAATNPIYYSGIRPDPDFDSMLCTKLETAIAPAIGASIGSVLRTVWGDAALIIYVLAVCALHALIVMNFVYKDINVPKSSAMSSEFGRKSMLQRLKSSTAFYLRPSIICMMLCALAPVYILVSVDTYVMPLFNRQTGLSDVYIGFITFIITMITVFLVPKILVITGSGKRDDIFWISVLMTGLSVAFAFFGFGTDMKTLVLAAVAVRMLYAVFTAMSTRMNLRESKEAGLNPNDTGVGFEIVSLGASTFNSIIMSLMITSGYKFFGYAWCIICAGCALFAAVTGRIRNVKQ